MDFDIGGALSAGWNRVTTAVSNAVDEAVQTAQEVVEQGPSLVQDSLDVASNYAPPSLNDVVEAAKKAAEETSGFGKDVGEGALDAVVDMGEGVVQMVTHPVQTAEGIVHVATHPGLLVDALVDPYKEAVESGHVGKAIGRGIVDIGSLFIGAGEVSTAAKGLGKTAKAAGVAEEVTIQATKTADKLGAAAKVGDVAAEEGILYLKNSGEATQAFMAEQEAIDALASADKTAKDLVAKYLEAEKALPPGKSMLTSEALESNLKAMESASKNLPTEAARQRAADAIPKLQQQLEMTKAYQEAGPDLLKAESAAKEAEASMKAKYPDITWDFSGMSPEVLKPAMDQLDKLQKRWPEAFKNVKYVGGLGDVKTLEALFPNGVGSGSKTVAQSLVDMAERQAYAGVAKGFGQSDCALLLNDRFFGNPEVFQRSLTVGEQMGEHPLGCGSFEGVITHEYGHLIDKVNPKVTDAFKQATLDLKRGISGNAASDLTGREAFADAFAIREHVPMGTKGTSKERLYLNLGNEGNDYMALFKQTLWKVK